tara:strand:+ start:306 stop:1265 length:960 start_codon:yes stop_codon:yes gene_type:complete
MKYIKKVILGVSLGFVGCLSAQIMPEPDDSPLDYSRVIDDGDIVFVPTKYLQMGHFFFRSYMFQSTPIEASTKPQRKRVVIEMLPEAYADNEQKMRAFKEHYQVKRTDALGYPFPADTQYCQVSETLREVLETMENYWISVNPYDFPYSCKMKVEYLSTDIATQQKLIDVIKHGKPMQAHYTIDIKAKPQEQEVSSTTSNIPKDVQDEIQRLKDEKALTPVMSNGEVKGWKIESFILMENFQNAHALNRSPKKMKRSLRKKLWYDLHEQFYENLDLIPSCTAEDGHHEPQKYWYLHAQDAVEAKPPESTRTLFYLKVDI